jgi:triacylglycerol esterase/lipase EstA (alpha/beta hydrolase family)
MVVGTAGFALAQTPTAQASVRPAAATSSHGPRLGVPAKRLKAALHCSAGLAHATRRPILLVPGTTLTPSVNFSWNYEKAFDQRHWPWCAVRLPHHAMSDAQVSAEYVVHAIRSMRARSGHKVDVVGYSQGGMLPRWALKYWPGTRRDVADVVGIDPSNHGTLDANGACTLTCAPSIWQQQTGSHFLTALNTGPETWAGIDYTVVYSHTDEVVVPNLSPKGSSALHTGKGRIADIAVQSICPADTSEHLAMGTYDSVGYAVVVDALTHHGPAKAGRVSTSVCTQPFMPGVDPATFAADFGRVVATAADQLATYPHTASEPALKPYARG